MEKFFQKETALSFDDVLLVPEKTNVSSRLDTNLKTKIGKIEIDIPIMSAAMDTVTGKEMAQKLATLGGIGIIHRFQSIDSRIQNCNFFGGVKGVAIGFNDSISDIISLSKYCDIIALDIANAHSDQALEFTKKLSSTLRDTECSLMVGNVCTYQATKELCEAGADIVKVGIGGGSACSTRIVTGFGYPTLSAILECKRAIESSYSNKISYLVADGGIRNSGDIAKAIAAGADCVMLGSLLAGTDESPGEIKQTKHGKKKMYRGMASTDAQNNWQGKKNGVAAEGISALIPYKGPVETIVGNLVGGLRSSLTYGNARNLKEFYENTTFVKVSSNSISESKPHILESDGAIVEKIF